MDHFHYKENELFAEEVALKDVAEKYGTPSFVYSKATLERHAKAYINSFKSMDGLVCFSVKALSNILILKTLKNSGCGFDIVSGGELHRALLAGADPKKLFFQELGNQRLKWLQALKIIFFLLMLSQSKSLISLVLLLEK